MRGIPGTKRPKVVARAATADELIMLQRNCSIACIFYGLSEEASLQAQLSAAGNPYKAARCYAAIVRSL